MKKQVFSWIVSFTMVSMGSLALLKVPTFFHQDAYFYVNIPQDGGSIIHGRLLIMLSTDSTSEPRFQISDGPGTQLIFGMDVQDWPMDKPIPVFADAYGYPVKALSEVPPGS
jgi:hypothetical protein